MNLTPEMIAARVAAYRNHLTLHPSAEEVKAYESALKWAAKVQEQGDEEPEPPKPITTKPRASFTITGRPVSTTNSQRIVQIPIKGRNGKTRPMVLKSKEAVAWGTEAKAQLLEQGAHLLRLSGPVAVELDVYRLANVGDVDNFVKGALDALQAAGAILNDRQVMRITAEKFKDKANPRYVIRIHELPTGNLFE